MASLIDEIVRRSGLSRPTVKHVLGTRGHLYRESTRQRVLDVAAELGYRRNGAAKAMSTGRFSAYGLLMSVNPRDAVVPHPVLWGMQRAMGARDLHLTIGQLPDAALTDPVRMPRVLREWSVDGLIISYTDHYPQAMLDVIERHAIPSVWLNVKLPHDCVHPDDFATAQEATRQLLRLGHRRIAFASWWELGHYSYADRYDGYCAAMAEAGLQPRDLRAATIGKADAMGAYARHLLTLGDRPTAFLSYAIGDLHALLTTAYQLGLRVPHDLSLACIDGEAGDSVLPPTMLQLPGGELGEAAVEMLHEKVANPSVRLRPRALPGTYLPGQTAGVVA